MEKLLSCARHCIIIQSGTVEDGFKKDFVPRVTLGTILNHRNLELL